MKMRKLFAGLAAAATLLSGMAIGVAAAQADDAPLLQVGRPYVHAIQVCHVRESWRWLGRSENG